MKKILILFLLLFVTACTSSSDYSSTLVECTTASDCVPSLCCHASSCIFKDQAPDCTDTFCSLDCQEGTLDCNQGACGCINNKCQVVSN